MRLTIDDGGAIIVDMDILAQLAFAVPVAWALLTHEDI